MMVKYDESDGMMTLLLNGKVKQFRETTTCNWCKHWGDPHKMIIKPDSWVTVAKCDHFKCDTPCTGFCSEARIKEGI